MFTTLFFLTCSQQLSCWFSIDTMEAKCGKHQ